MALGITLKKENVSKFKEEFEEYAKSKKVEEIIPVININEKVSLKDVSLKDIKELKLLEPFGEANPVPLFQINELKIEAIRALSDGKHLKMMLKDENNKILEVIGFNMGNLSQEYQIGTKVDVVGNLEINSYNGIETIQMNLKDIRHTV